MRSRSIALFRASACPLFTWWFAFLSARLIKRVISIGWVMIAFTSVWITSSWFLFTFPLCSSGTVITYFWPNLIVCPYYPDQPAMCTAVWAEVNTWVRNPKPFWVWLWVCWVIHACHCCRFRVEWFCGSKNPYRTWWGNRGWFASWFMCPERIVSIRTWWVWWFGLKWLTII